MAVSLRPSPERVDADRELDDVAQEAGSGFEPFTTVMQVSEPLVQATFGLTVHVFEKADQPRLLGRADLQEAEPADRGAGALPDLDRAAIAGQDEIDKVRGAGRI